MLGLVAGLRDRAARHPPADARTTPSWPSTCRCWPRCRRSRGPSAPTPRCCPTPTRCRARPRPTAACARRSCSCARPWRPRAATRRRGRRRHAGTSQVILVTSAGPSEGKTTTVANLATVFAEAEYSVLVINCDFRRPRLHRYLGGSDEARKVVQSDIPGVRMVNNVLSSTNSEPGRGHRRPAPGHRGGPGHLRHHPARHRPAAVDQRRQRAHRRGRPGRAGGPLPGARPSPPPPSAPPRCCTASRPPWPAWPCSAPATSQRAVLLLRHRGGPRPEPARGRVPSARPAGARRRPEPRRHGRPTARPAAAPTRPAARTVSDSRSSSRPAGGLRPAGAGRRPPKDE